MIVIPAYLRLLQRIEQVRRMRMDAVLFNDADGCRESMQQLERLAAEPIADLDDHRLAALEQMIVDGVLDHVVVHLGDLMEGGERDAEAFLARFGPKPGFDDLPAVLQAVEGVNVSRARPIDALRRSFAERFSDQPAVGERLSVLAGRWLTGGMPRDRPAGSAVLAGPYGSGRSLLVTRFAQTLSAHGVGGEAQVDEIDLRGFTGSETGLRRLAERLAELARDPARRVIAFDNIEEAAPTVLAMLQTLVETGVVSQGGKTASLDNRFLFFMLARGMKGDEPVDAVPRAVAERLGNAFRSAVQDVIVLPRPSDETLAAVVRDHVIACMVDFSTHAGQRIEVDASMIRSLVQRVLERGGFGHAAPSVVQDHLRLPVSDLIVRGIVNGRGARIVHEDGVDLLVQGRLREPLPVAKRHGADKAPPLDLEAELGRLVGLEPVKDMLRTMHAQLLADRRRREAGIEVRTDQSLHMLFLGNPGTGKTTVARLVARMLRELGVLREGQLIEVGRSQLVASYVGQTAPKTEAVVASAIGGVLFIDEAYALTRGQDSFGREAVDTLVREIENHRGDLVVILAGYTKEMGEFLESNSGLQSRFPNRFEFPDYTADELARIAVAEAESRGLRIAPDAAGGLPGLFDGMVVAGRSDQGNGRLARNVIEAAMRRQSMRVEAGGITDRDGLTTLTATDLGTGAAARPAPARDALAMLDDIVGLDAVKEFVRDLAAQVRMDARRRELGLPSGEARTLHMVFKGNPGTGKTTVARVIAQLFKELRILKGGQLVEVDRSGLVAGYVGQTALKTQQKIREALGGVLFVDEAYALVGDGQDSFGREALDTLVKGMEDHRESLVVVLAGYSGDMERLLEVNAGLRSRFPNVVEFVDYTPDELMRIARLQLAAGELTATAAAEDRLRQLCTLAAGRADLGNGRFVRNLIEEARRRQSRRLVTMTEATREALLTIEAVDLPATDHGA